MELSAAHVAARRMKKADSIAKELSLLSYI